MKKIYCDCFPECKTTYDYDNALKDPTYATYILVKKDDIPCAITGYYTYKAISANDVFMGWFGVLPEYRRQGIASEIFDWTVATVKKMGYDYFRLNTDSKYNQNAIKLYLKKGMIEEEYFRKAIIWENVEPQKFSLFHLKTKNKLNYGIIVDLTKVMRFIWGNKLNSYREKYR